jgi:hypothetical protein
MSNLEVVNQFVESAPHVQEAASLLLASEKLNLSIKNASTGWQPVVRGAARFAIFLTFVNHPRIRKKLLRFSVTKSTIAFTSR